MIRKEQTRDAANGLARDPRHFEIHPATEAEIESHEVWRHQMNDDFTAMGSLTIGLWWQLLLIVALAYAGGAIYGIWSVALLIAAGFVALNLASLILGRKKG